MVPVKQLLGKSAVVAGSSISGLLASVVLAQFFQRVTLLERDDDPLEDQSKYRPRKGVPQGKHIHILLSSGEAAINRLLPGIDKELLEEGAIAADFARDIHWYLNGHWFPRFVSGLTFFLQTQPLLEAKIRQRVQALPNITIEYGRRVSGYRLSENGKAVDAALVAQGGGQDIAYDADLIVDATGRGSAFPRWLEANGFSAPPQSLVGIDLAYATCLFERPKNVNHDWVLTAHYPTPPDELRGGVINCVEGGMWQVTLYGYHGDHPPTDELGFKEFARSFPNQQIYNSIKDLTPLGSIHRHRFPGSLQRHYERAARLPGGIVVIGDGVSSLNPAFGQGISKCALEVLSLQENLTRIAQNKEELLALPRRHYKSLAKLVKFAWNFVADENLKYPQTTGKRPVLYPVTRWYKDRIVMSTDLDVVNQFFRVMHLVDPQSTLLRPSALWKILKPNSSAADSSSEPVHA